MDYADNIRRLLRPLGLFELDKGFGAAELSVVGAALDVCGEEMEFALREAILTTAGDYGLGALEDILPWRPAVSTIGARRAALLALLSIDSCGFTKKAISDALTGCGVAATAVEGDESGVVIVTFIGCRGIPDNFEKVNEIISGIIPCHVEIIYAFLYSTWDDIEALGLTWDRIETMALDWTALETYM